MTFNRDWEEQAQNWLASARTPGHDVDWHYRSDSRLRPGKRRSRSGAARDEWRATWPHEAIA
jgi:hypothetical protein